MSGGGDSKFAFGLIIFALAMTLLLPIGLSVFTNTVTATDLNTEEQLSGYYDFTGTSPSREAIWSLTGIYTPFGVDRNGEANTTNYGHTDDGWLYGESLSIYEPSQYKDTNYAYKVVKGDDGLFRYAYNYQTVPDDPDDPDSPTHEERVSVTYTGNHKSGDLYTDVSFDPTKKSNIFFTQSMREEQDGFFYYQYSGYRMAFQPTSSYRTQNADGDYIDVIPNTTSLSLVWYQFYTSQNSGISGQLIISSNDYSVAYLNSAQIIQAFNTTTSTAKFTLNFSGVPINLYVRIDPIQLANGLSVQQCYDLGYWSVMVTSLSTDSSAYMQSDNELNPYSIFNKMIDLLTFNYQDFGISDEMGILCSLLIVVPFYAGLIAICIGGGIQMLVWVGILAAIQGIATLISNIGWPL